MTAPTRPNRGCPICGTASAAAYRPFCSKRCRDIDLGNWAAEAYAVPGEADSEIPDSDAGEPEA